MASYTIRRQLVQGKNLGHLSPRAHTSTVHRPVDSWYAGPDGTAGRHGRRPIDVPEARFWVVALSVIGIAITATLSISLATSSERSKTTRFVFTAVLPLLGTWVGTVLLAFSFAHDNLQTATESTIRLSQRVEPRTPVQQVMSQESQVDAHQLKAQGSCGRCTAQRSPDANACQESRSHPDSGRERCRSICRPRLFDRCFRTFARQGSGRRESIHRDIRPARNRPRGQTGSSDPWAARPSRSASHATCAERSASYASTPPLSSAARATM